MLSILASSGASSAAGMGGMILWLVILFAFMYFFMIRPQKKETQKKNAMLSELATGDTVLTTSGFYGTVIDITDDTVIVEFGSNKNCRIPMQKSAIAAVENRKKHNVNRVLYHKTSAVAGVLSVSERASGKRAAYGAAVSRMIRIKI